MGLLSLASVAPGLSRDCFSSSFACGGLWIGRRSRLNMGSWSAVATNLYTEIVYMSFGSLTRRHWHCRMSGPATRLPCRRSHLLPSSGGHRRGHPSCPSLLLCGLRRLPWFSSAGCGSVLAEFLPLAVATATAPRRIHASSKRRTLSFLPPSGQCPGACTAVWLVMSRRHAYAVTPGWRSSPSCPPMARNAGCHAWGLCGRRRTRRPLLRFGFYAWPPPAHEGSTVRHGGVILERRGQAAAPASARLVWGLAGCGARQGRAFRVVPVVGTWGGAGGVESARSRKEFKTLLAFGSDPNSLHDLLGMSVFLRKTRLCKQFGPRSCKEFAPDPKAGRVLNSLRDLAGFALRAALPPPSGQPRPDPPAGRPPPGCGSCFLGGM